MPVSRSDRSGISGDTLLASNHNKNMSNEEQADLIERLEKEIAALREQLKAAENTVRRAKDPNPVQRPSLKRVFKLVHDACMTLTR
ncbi:hypothetical protein UH38_09110, partial [Aliterella atlantica CENA595]